MSDCRLPIANCQLVWMESSTAIETGLIVKLKSAIGNEI